MKITVNQKSVCISEMPAPISSNYILSEVLFDGSWNCMPVKVIWIFDIENSRVKSYLIQNDHVKIPTQLLTRKHKIFVIGVNKDKQYMSSAAFMIPSYIGINGKHKTDGLYTQIIKALGGQA